MKRGFFAFLLITVLGFMCMFTNAPQSYASEPCRCDGNHGYVASKYIKLMEGSTIYAKVTLDDKDDWSYLNVREEPSLDSKIIKKLHHGDTVKVGESSGTQDGISWVLIHY